MTTKKLTPRQARWAKFLSEFNFVVTYQTGKKNEKADVLTRKPNEQPISNEDYKHRMQVLLPPKQIKIQSIKVNQPQDEPPNNQLAKRSVEAEEAEELEHLHAAKSSPEPQPKHKESVETKDSKKKIDKPTLSRI